MGSTRAATRAPFASRTMRWGPGAPPVDLTAVQLAREERRLHRCRTADLMKSIDDEQSVAAQYVGPVAGSSSALTVLRLPHRQHRTGGQTDHPLRDAAEQEVVEPGSAVCAHDDQVRALFLRDL